MQQIPYLSKEFLSQLDAILDFYSKDSVEAVWTFYCELLERLRSISYMPYRFRKNKTINREDTRDLCGGLSYRTRSHKNTCNI